MRRALMLALVLAMNVEALKRKKALVSDVTIAADDAKIHVGYLQELVSKEMYQVINTPSYRFCLYMSLGFVPKEADFVAFVSTLCNVLYVCMTLVGFLLLPQDTMLIITVLTFAVGPALVLVMLGAIMAFLALSALYPMVMTTFLCTGFLFSSRLFQVVGKYLGLDQDKDGDVDWLDLVAWASRKPVGQALRLNVLHKVFNTRRNATPEHILERLDQLESKIVTH